MVERYESDLTRKEKRHLEAQKIKSLPWKKKIEYLWTYYKFVLVIAAAVVLLVSAAVTMYRNAVQNPVFSMVIVDADRQDEEKVQKLESELEECIRLEGRHDVIRIDTSASSGDESAQTIKTIIAISPMEDNDLAVCDAETYSKFHSQGAFADWRDILGEDYEKYEPYIVQGALDLSKSSNWVKLGLTQYEPVLAGVPARSEHQENVKKVVEYLFQVCERW